MHLTGCWATLHAYSNPLDAFPVHGDPMMASLSVPSLPNGMALEDVIVDYIATIGHCGSSDLITHEKKLCSTLR